MSATHSAGFVKMSEWTFQSFSSLSKQRFSAIPAYSSTILVDRSLCFSVTFPTTPLLFWFGNIGSQIEPFQIHNPLGTVISLVGYNLLDSFQCQCNEFKRLFRPSGGVAS